MSLNDNALRLKVLLFNEKRIYILDYLHKNS